MPSACFVYFVSGASSHRLLYASPDPQAAASLVEAVSVIVLNRVFGHPPVLSPLVPLGALRLFEERPFPINFFIFRFVLYFVVLRFAYLFRLPLYEPGAHSLQYIYTVRPHENSGCQL